MFNDELLCIILQAFHHTDTAGEKLKDFLDEQEVAAAAVKRAAKLFDKAGLSGQQFLRCFNVIRIEQTYIRQTGRHIKDPDRPADLSSSDEAVLELYEGMLSGLDTRLKRELEIALSENDQEIIFTPDYSDEVEDDGEGKFTETDTKLH